MDGRLNVPDRVADSEGFRFKADGFPAITRSAGRVDIDFYPGLRTARTGVQQ